jgi:hypothetical protein
MGKQFLKRQGLVEIPKDEESVGKYCNDLNKTNCASNTVKRRYILDKFATGRYEVRFPSGLRAGSIIGGKRVWCAEIGNRVLGYQSTKNGAAEMILADVASRS